MVITTQFCINPLAMGDSFSSKHSHFNENHTLFLRIAGNGCLRGATSVRRARKGNWMSAAGEERAVLHPEDVATRGYGERGGVRRRQVIAQQ